MLLPASGAARSHSIRKYECKDNPLTVMVTKESARFADDMTFADSFGNGRNGFLARNWARLSKRTRRRSHGSSSPASNGVKELAVSRTVHQPSAQVSAANAEPHDLNGDDPDRRHIVNRGMDKLRRSLRKSFRRGKSLTSEQPSSSAGNSLARGSKSSSWQPDEAAVRAAACSFYVKYLGSVEVYESRGMHICEGALQHLRSRKRVTKAIVYISGDGIRVVDQENNRGLIVDQTIEKVSFCAPDRHNDKGFAYICRDGATRRWMCHGFMATKESGERLSHAVGCAFAICLEKKRKREAETAAFQAAQALAAVRPNGHATEETNGFNRDNAAYSSFRRQLSIAERRLDPQKAILNVPPLGSASATTSRVGEDALAKPRPAPNPELFERQSSFRMPMPATNPNAFRRFNSVRGDFVSKTTDGIRTLFNEPIQEGEDEQEADRNMRTSTSLQFNVVNECDKENQAAMPFYLQGISNPGLQDTPKHRPLSAVAATQSFANGDQGPSLQHAPSGTVSNASAKADEWLQQMFKASLSFGNNGVQKNTPYTTAPYAYPPFTNGSMSFGADSFQQMPRSFSSDNCRASYSSDYACGPPPQQPPPPLPPSANTSVLPPTAYNVPVTMNGQAHESVATSSQAGSIPPANSTKNPSPDSTTETKLAGAHLRTHSRKSSGSNRKSIEYQLLEEVDAPQSPPRAPSPQGIAQATELDVFGQPIFTRSKCAEAPSELQSKLVLSNDDPFDVKWSTLVLETTSARSTSPSLSARLPRLENPFSSESTPVNI